MSDSQEQEIGWLREQLRAKEDALLGARNDLAAAEVVIAQCHAQIAGLMRERLERMGAVLAFEAHECRIVQTTGGAWCPYCGKSGKVPFTVGG